ncbi:MAG: lytic transglycosylase [Cardiobacteriales bacterium]|nr:MAG: lytic transglycosylase [Cardiobacteriales bacterium]
MRYFLSLCLVLMLANTWGKSCGTIIKDGIAHNISCDLATQKASTSTSRCRATISFKGKTQHFTHRCTPKNSATVPQVVLEPSGGFKARQMIHKGTINTLADQYNIEAALVHAIISVESAYRSDVVSNKGAVGLMQLMPTTAAELNVADSFDAKANIDGGIRYLKAQLNRFDGNIDLALAAYNAGAQAVIAANNRIPPYTETQRYVKRVKTYRDHYLGDWEQHIK